MNRDLVDQSPIPPDAETVRRLLGLLGSVSEVDAA